MQPATDAAQLAAWRARLDCGFAQVDEVFADCMAQAKDALSAEGLQAYLDAARFLGKMGRGAEPVLIFLQTWPDVAQTAGEAALPPLLDALRTIWKSPNGKAIAVLLQALPGVARRLKSAALLQDYLALGVELMERTSGSIHGIHKTYASPGLPEFFRQSPKLLEMLSLGGLRRWMDYGVRNHGRHPQRQTDYFRLQSPDSRAVLQRERHGTLFADHQRALDLYLRALWQDGELLVPYAATDGEQAVAPYYDEAGIRLPEVYDDAAGVAGIDRYRAALAHMAAHRRWSTPLFADNYSPLQRLTIECFEDARVDALALRAYPGLRRVLRALHPQPAEDACDDATHACLRHRLTLFSRAVLDPEHGYRDAVLRDFVQRFHALMANGGSSTAEMAQLALSWAARTRRQSDQSARVYFADTAIGYRDDNRHLWRFHELSDDEEQFETPAAADSRDETQPLPPRHYPEWDHDSQSYRPDWVSLYEHLHPGGDARIIDRLLARHAVLARQIKRLLDLLKPQDKARLRYQLEGSELDLDIALRSLIDFKAGSTPDMRINMSHRTDGRSIAVLLLLDLSASLNDRVAGSDQTILQLSQESVALLAGAIDHLGDPLAIAGFHSNTRHEVRYLHIKGFDEPWGQAPKARLAALEAGWSTRMGAALRHAAHYLGARRADKKLLLVLTDGRPSDVDVADEQALVADARQAVHEVGRQGIFSHCINLDPQADAYVGDIFGRHYTVIDHVQRLPEQLPKLFMALTR